MQPPTPQIAPDKTLPVMSGTIHAGFPSPAAEYIHETLNLNDLLITHPSSTFFAWAEGTSMELSGIFDGDLLIIDKSLSPSQGDIVIASVDSQKEFTCKVFDLRNKCLIPSSPYDFPKIDCTEGVLIEGVVAQSIRMHRITHHGRK
jgi:DNA polymerase V